MHCSSVGILIVSLLASPACSRAFAQGTPPCDTAASSTENPKHEESSGPPSPSGPETKLQQIKTMVKKELKQEVKKAINQTSPAVQQWRPLTAEQKFRVFLKHTDSPYTFAGAAVDAVADKMENDNLEYARGFAGYSQHYAIELANGESDALFESFLIPVLLRQDPRYFRNPALPFWKRTLYSLSRLVITRNDRGSDTFNASYVVGGAASQALSDVYVPGHRQGLHPIADRLTFNLARDGGFNLLHEFWPDLRRKFLHRKDSR
jgi:hypothetical protein